jgi:hypothetical protein
MGRQIANEGESLLCGLDRYHHIFKMEFEHSSFNDLYKKQPTHGQFNSKETYKIVETILARYLR